MPAPELAKIVPASALTAAQMEERDFLIWLRSVERRAILPLKWAIFATALAFWLLSHPNYLPPPVPVFALFTVYFMFNLGETYFMLLSRVSLSQTRVLCIISYYIDVAFVTLLIYLDARKYAAPDGASTDFYVFYFLLILRGFALFRTAQANLRANAFIGAVFILSLVWQDASLSVTSGTSMFRVIFIWLVITMSWFIVEVINRQKEEILRTRERLIQSENMAAVGELAAGVAHEINNPIGIISAYAEFLKKNAPPEDPRREDFETIHKEAQRCERIIGELLTYARPQPHGMAPADLRQLNDEVLDFLLRRKLPGTEGDLEVEKNYADNLPLLMLDSNQLKQALLNLYLNARQAMPTGGTLRISLQPLSERNQVRLLVHDTGAGITEDDLKRVFDPFFTKRAKGTGLGLSITRRIIETHGGTITLSSDPGKGTTVEVLLPTEASAPS
ncbi:MAG: sensor histidine kinase [Candidatus Sumerlaeaceae bacterium]